MFAKFIDTIRQNTKSRRKAQQVCCSGNWSITEDHLFFSLSEKKVAFVLFFFFHSMGGKLHNGIACIKDIAYFFVSSYLVGIDDLCIQ